MWYSSQSTSHMRH